MASWNPAQSPAANTVATLVRTASSSSGTQPPSAEANRRRAPASASSSTLGVSPTAWHTVSHASSRSLPAAGIPASSIRTTTTDSTSPTRPRASRIVWDVRIGTPRRSSERASSASPRTRGAISTIAATSTPCSSASAAVRRPRLPEPTTTMRRAASAR